VGEVLSDALIGDLTDPARWLEEHLVPTQAVAVISRLAKAQQRDRANLGGV
jgi:hypothetical protein